MITIESIEYRGKEYKVISVSNEHFSASFASTDLYDAIFSDDKDREEMNDDAQYVWDEIYYFTDLVEKFDGAEFVRELFKEDEEILYLYQGA